MRDCLGCPDHTLYCKLDCKHWEEHEKEKQRRYKANEITRKAGLSTPTLIYYNDFKAKNKKVVFDA